jgi:hypothetical protein
VRFLEQRCRDALWWLITHHSRFPRVDDLSTFHRHASSSKHDPGEME